MSEYDDLLAELKEVQAEREEERRSSEEIRDSILPLLLEVGGDVKGLDCVLLEELLALIEAKMGESELDYENVEFSDEEINDLSELRINGVEEYLGSVMLAGGYLAYAYWFMGEARCWIGFSKQIFTDDQIKLGEGTEENTEENIEEE